MFVLVWGLARDVCLLVFTLLLYSSLLVVSLLYVLGYARVYDVNVGFGSI